MGKVSFDISMSLDGFITGANRRSNEPVFDLAIMIRRSIKICNDLEEKNTANRGSRMFEPALAVLLFKSLI